MAPVPYAPSALIPDPIDVIKSHSVAENPAQFAQFCATIAHLYQFRLLKDIMDFTTTKVQQGYLQFIVQEEKFFDLDEGNCRTFSAPSVFGAMLNRFKNNKHYIISIKKITTDVIMHEMAHMVEQELGRSFDPLAFMQIITGDIKNAESNTGNVSLLEAVKSIMITEVNRYPDSQKTSELFARYFQMLASAHDVVRYGTAYSYSIDDMEKVFRNTGEYMALLLQSFYRTTEYYSIKAMSEKYIKNPSDIAHRWSEQKIHSFHKDTTDGVHKPQWRKDIKSIKADPFK